MNRSHLMLLSTACGFALTASPALAQDAPSAPPPAEAGVNGDDMIILTARRQNERLQVVPASVAVLSADTLQRTGAVMGAVHEPVLLDPIIFVAWFAALPDTI